MIVSEKTPLGRPALAAVAGVILLLFGLALPSRASVRRIGTRSGEDGPPRINDAGAIVIQSPPSSVNGDREIDWWDGSSWQYLLHPSAVDARPQINRRGQMTWQGFDGTDTEIYLWDGLTILPLTENGVADTDPQINDAGQVVWVEDEGAAQEIDLWNGGATQRLTNNDRRDSSLRINNQGQVVWVSGDGTSSEIELWDGQRVRPLTGGSQNVQNPCINNRGQVVWQGFDGADWEIYLWDGQSVRQLTNNNVPDTDPEINDAGSVVWQEFDGTDWEIDLWDGSAIRRLTDNRIDDVSPQISASGAVVWASGSPSGAGIYQWDGSATRQISSTADGQSAPQINSLNEVVWTAPAGSSREIDLYAPDGLFWLTLNPWSVVGGNPVTGRITFPALGTTGITFPAPGSTGMSFALTSGNPGLAAVPAGAVQSLPGAGMVTFPITTAPTAAPVFVPISAAAGGITRTVSLALAPVGVASLRLDEDAVRGGASLTTTLRLTAPAPAGGVSVALASDNLAAAQVPERVIIPAGQQEVTVPVTTAPVAGDTYLEITATYGSRFQTPLLVSAPRLTALTLDPTSITGGLSATGTVTLDAPAASGGTWVQLTASNPTAVTVPARVTVPGGALQATFSIPAAPTQGSLLVDLTASLRDSTKKATLLVLSPQIAVGTGAIQRITLSTNDLVYDPYSGKIYASVPSTVPTIGNSITSINPTTGAVGPSVFIGSEPAKLALSDDGQYLYAGLDGAAAVRRFDLRTGMAGPQFSLGADTIRLAGPYFAQDLVVLPGLPESVAVVRQAQNGPPNVAVYDRGVPRPTVLQDQRYVSTIARSATASRLYGASDDLYASAFYRLQVESAGVSLLDQTTGLLGPHAQIRFDDGLLYSADGPVLDPEARQVIGSFSGLQPPALVAPDSRAGRVFFLTSDAPTRRLMAYDARTQVLLGVQDVPGVSGTAGSLIRWGEESAAGGGLAFRTTEGQVFLIRSSLVPPVSLSVSFDPASVVGGSPSTGTVRLPTPAPAGGAEVALQSSDPAATVPARVTVPAGASSATFPVGTSPTAQGVTAVITAAFDGMAGTGRLQVQAPILDSLRFDPPRIARGGTVTGTVTLNGPAPPGGAVVSLYQFGAPETSIPDHVTVAAGATSASFPVTLGPNPQSTVYFRALYGVWRETTLEVVPDVESLTFDPPAVPGGDPATGTIRLGYLAPPGGLAVELTSSNPALAAVPGEVTVPAGELTATFKVTTSRPAATTSVVISATVAGVTRTGELEVATSALQALTLAPNPVTGGQNATGTVILSGPAPAGGIQVLLSSADPARAPVPPQVTVPAGARSVSFAIPTAPVTANVSVDLTATSGSLVRVATLLLFSAEPAVGANSFFKIPLATNDLAYDPISRRLYASIPASSPAMPNSVAAIDPARGTVGASIATAGEPGRLALSDDGQYLYVALGDGTQVQRIDLQLGRVEPPFPLGSDPVAGPYAVADMAVPAGSPETLAVSRRALHPAAQHTDIALYDRGISRPAVADLQGGTLLIAASDSLTRLYAYHRSDSGSAYLKMALDPTGVSLLESSSDSNLLGGTVSAIKFSEGLLFTNLGLVVDPEQLRWVTYLPGLPGAFGAGFDHPERTLVAPDAAAGRVFFLTDSGSGRQLKAFDSRSFQAVGDLEVPEVAGTASSLVRWGSDGLAFRTDAGELLLIRTDLALATPVPVPDWDLHVDPALVRGGTETTGTIVLGEAAPWGGFRLSVTSDNPAAVTVPDSIAVPSRAPTVTFRITTHPVAAITTVHVTSSAGGHTHSGTVQVLPGAITLSLTPSMALRGHAARATITLSGPAPAGGMPVRLTSDRPEVARVPGSLTIPAGATQATFPITTLRVRTAATATISATAGGATQSAALTVLSSGIASFLVKPGRIIGGKPAEGIVALWEPAPEGGARIELSSDLTGFASVPASVLIPAGRHEATFPVLTHRPGRTTTGALSAAFVGITTAARLTVIRR